MLDLWAVCRYDLRLSERETGSLNLKEYDALLRRKQTEMNHERLNAGIVAAAVYNAAPSTNENRKAVSPLDFVPQWKAEVESEEHDLTKMTPEEQRDYLFNLFGMRVIREK
jgi:hypothetical protein